MFALGARDTLKNVVRSGSSIAKWPFRVGDMVQIGGIEGVVKRSVSASFEFGDMRIGY